MQPKASAISEEHVDCDNWVEPTAYHNDSRPLLGANNNGYSNQPSGGNNNRGGGGGQEKDLNNKLDLLMKQLED
eukprot:7918533-Pyramimonas_sp.AAC.1